MADRLYTRRYGTNNNDTVSGDCSDDLIYGFAIHDFELLTDRIAIIGSTLEDLTFTQDGSDTVIGYDNVS